MSTVSLRLAAALGLAVGVQPAGPVDRHVGTSVPVRLVLDQTRYAPGATGHVSVRIGEDGYLVVLYAQPDGHVNVAFPLDPGSSEAVKADSEIEIRARGGLGAFTVEDSSGVGTWYAAISTRPFRFDSIATKGHWDYRHVPRMTDQSGVERALTGFVEELATGRFDYDIVTFAIDPSLATPSSLAPQSSTPELPSPPPPATDTTAIGTPITWPGPIVWLPGWVGPWSWTPPAAGPYYDRALPGTGLPSTRPVVPSGVGADGTPKDAPPPPESHPPRGERRHGGSGGSGSDRHHGS